MSQQKRIAAIHDISGIGKCSLTAALPVLSAAGVETAVIPTAVLSTHTGGFTGYTYRDLTDDMADIAKHWKSCGFRFDAIYSGFLGSAEQVDIVAEIIDTLRDENTLILVDPAMADNGRLYTTFDNDFPQKMKRLVKSADILTPNITELCLLTDTEYISGPYSKDYIERLLKKSKSLGCKKTVLTGVYFDNEKLGAALYDCISGEISCYLSDKRDGIYYGTGDIFASSLLGGIICGIPFERSVQTAVDFVNCCIDKTNEMDTPIKYGVNFEAALPQYLKMLGII